MYNYYTLEMNDDKVINVEDTHAVIVTWKIIGCCFRFLESKICFSSDK